jgi:hypothetical protein
MQKAGFPVTKEQLRSQLAQVAKVQGVADKFSSDGIPGDKFMTNFLKRHPDVVVRKAEPTHGGRTALTEDQILNYFTVQKERLQTDEGMTDEDFTNAALWFNCDETMIRYENTLKVLAEKGSKNVFNRSVNEKDGLTVLACINAKGEYPPPSSSVQGY